MATSTPALLPPEDIDDRAPPTACRTKEKRSQGYSKILELVLPVCFTFWDSKHDQSVPLVSRLAWTVKRTEVRTMKTQ